MPGAAGEPYRSRPQPGQQHLPGIASLWHRSQGRCPPHGKQPRRTSNDPSSPVPFLEVDGQLQYELAGGRLVRHANLRLIAEQDARPARRKPQGRLARTGTRGSLLARVDHRHLGQLARANAVRPEDRLLGRPSGRQHVDDVRVDLGVVAAAEAPLLRRG